MMGLHSELNLRFDCVEVERCWFLQWRKVDEGLGMFRHKVLYEYASGISMFSPPSQGAAATTAKLVQKETHTVDFFAC
jgi:hypothetical protein